MAQYLYKQIEALDVFFDGECPLCRREIEMIRSRDKSGKLGFVDIAASDC
ncbi:MAG: DCC1-like thiol-disulfide oxidoreductase family protein [Planctomycetaceae bacterium]